MATFTGSHVPRVQCTEALYRKVSSNTSIELIKFVGIFQFDYFEYSYVVPCTQVLLNHLYILTFVHM